MSDAYPYPLDDTRTHWEGCWTSPGHHNCAVARVRELEQRLAEFDGARDLPADGWRVYWRSDPSEPWGEYHGVGVYRDEEGAKRAEAEYREMGHDTMRRPLTYVVTDARIWDSVRDRMVHRLLQSDGTFRLTFAAFAQALADELTTIALGEREET